VVDVMKSSFRAMEGKKNAFEIFGLDFIVDENLKVWLIEVNSSPTFEISTVTIGGVSLSGRL
jgi:tubulin monoglycylase TTLL3/8